MRETYIELIKVLAVRAEKEEELREPVAQIISLLGDENAPTHDQDIINFFSEFYIFLLFGIEPDRYDVDDAIKSWGDVHDRIRDLEQSPH